MNVLDYRAIGTSHQTKTGDRDLKVEKEKFDEAAAAKKLDQNKVKHIECSHGGHHGADGEAQEVDIEACAPKPVQKLEEPEAGGQVDGVFSEYVNPGRGKVWVRTFGCSHNVSDSEVMMGQLHAHGYELVDDEKA